MASHAKGVGGVRVPWRKTHAPPAGFQPMHFWKTWYMAMLTILLAKNRYTFGMTWVFTSLFVWNCDASNVDRILKKHGYLWYGVCGCFILSRRTIKYCWWKWNVICCKFSVTGELIQGSVTWCMDITFTSWMNFFLYKRGLVIQKSCCLYLICTVKVKRLFNHATL